MRTKIALLSIATFASVAYTATFLTVDAVMKNTKKYNEKEVTVRGRLDKYKKKTSKSGNKYTTFELKGETKSINVYMRDHLPKDPKTGDVVEVMGVFRESKTVGSATFKNEIDVTKVAGKKYGVKVIVGSK